MKTLKEDIYNLRYGLIVAALYIIIMQSIFHAVCPIRIFLHINCPGCGLTRACLALLRGDFVKSWQYNRTAILWIIAISLFVIDRYIKPLKVKPFPAIFTFVAIVTFINYILLFL